MYQASRRVAARLLLAKGEELAPHVWQRLPVAVRLPAASLPAQLLRDRGRAAVHGNGLRRARCMPLCWAIAGAPQHAVRGYDLHHDKLDIDALVQSHSPTPRAATCGSRLHSTMPCKDTHVAWARTRVTVPTPSPGGCHSLCKVVQQRARCPFMEARPLPYSHTARAMAVTHAAAAAKSPTRRAFSRSTRLAARSAARPGSTRSTPYSRSSSAASSPKSRCMSPSRGRAPRPSSDSSPPETAPAQKHSMDGFRNMTAASASGTSWRTRAGTVRSEHGNSWHT